MGATRTFEGEEGKDVGAWDVIVKSSGPGFNKVNALIISN
jgi:hypothetical protein